MTRTPGRSASTWCGDTNDHRPHKVGRMLWCLGMEGGKRRPVLTYTRTPTTHPLTAPTPRPKGQQSG